MQRHFSALSTQLSALLLAERDRWILWLPVGLGLGISLYFALPVEPPYWAGMTGLMAVFMLAWWVRGPFMKAALTVVFLLALGFSLSQWRTARVESPILAEEISLQKMTGRIADIMVKPEGSKLLLEEIAIPGEPELAVPKTVSVSFKTYDPLLQTGDRISLRAGLFPPPDPLMPGEFDFSRYFYFRGIGAVGYGIGKVTVLEATASEKPFEYRLADWRKQLSEHIRARMQEPYGAIAVSLITGDTAAIPQDTSDSMRTAGLAHILAVSGMNLAIVSAIIFFTMRAGLALIPAISLRFDTKKWAALISLVASFAYLAISGWPVSAQRAFFSIALVLLAILLDRESTPLRSIAFAAALILMIEPESLLGAGFQLSFAATLALISFYETFHERLKARLEGRRILLYLVGVLLSTLVAGAATAPLSLYHFHQYSNYGLLANLMAAPLVSFFLMPCVILLMLLMPLGLEGWLYAPLQWGVKGLLWCAQFVQTLPEAMIYPPPLPTWGMALIALGGLWLMLWQRRWRLLGLVGIAAGLASLCFVRLPDILISGDGKQVAMAIGEQADLVIVKGRQNRFGAEQWLRYFGQEQFITRKENEEEPSPLECDKLGCVLKKEGVTVAFVKDRAILAEECRSADLVIADFALQPGECAGAKQVIDAGTLNAYGAHAIWLRGGEIRMERAADFQGHRPWTRR